MTADQKKTTIVRLKTFHTQNIKPKKSNGQPAGPGKNGVIATGGKIYIVNFIGHHECSKNKGLSDQNFKRAYQSGQCFKSTKRVAEDISGSGCYVCCSPLVVGASCYKS